jgi:cephalosporin hydroxylase
MAKTIPNKRVSSTMEGSSSRERLKRAFKENMAKNGYEPIPQNGMDRQLSHTNQRNFAVRQQQMHEMRNTSPQIVNRIDSQKKNTNRVMVNINNKNKRKV